MRFLVSALVVLSIIAPAADAAPRLTLVRQQPVRDDVTRLTYRYGPLTATAGSNYIMVGPAIMGAIAPQEGYTIRTRPGLVRQDGSVPPVEALHMHHAVFLNMARRDPTAPTLPGERFFAFAEEKTIGELPHPYGYFVRPTDPVAVNYMLHNGTTTTENVWIELEIDFVALDSDLGRTLRHARPVWLDVENGSAYPVFDVHRGAGRDGTWEYPDESPEAYEGRAKLNQWVADRDGVLVAAAGHLHPGGLWVDLRSTRDGRRVDLFRSEAVYFDPNGPVSWDVAMTVSPKTWRAGVRKGDVLSVHTTYETERASWYESMGIVLAYMSDDSGPDPFVTSPAVKGDVTHGHLPEAGNYGGGPGGYADATKLPDGQTVADGVGIGNFLYMPGDLTLSGTMGNPPLVQPGEKLRFGNFDAIAGILHTVTACKAPCSGATGVSYPLANGDVQFDSGQIGYGPPGATSAAQKPDWTLPTDLRPGTYTYFCRVHPFMRGAFRIAGTPAAPASGTAATPPARRARVRLRGGRLKVRGSRVRVPVACQGTSCTCSGSIRLVVPRARPLVIGRASYRVRAGRSANVVVRLNRSGRSLVRRSRGPIRIRVEARPGRGAVVSRGASLRRS